MAKFPTEIERAVTVRVPLARAYAFLWDVVTSSACVPGLDHCTPVGADCYRFVYQEKTTGPVSLVVQYTARYEGNGRDEIRFTGTAADGDNTDVTGVIRLEPAGDGATRIVLRQTVAPDTPVPRFLQGLIRGFVEREAAGSVEEYLDGVKRTLEA